MARKEWNIQKYLPRNKVWIDFTPVKKLMTYSKMKKELERINNEYDGEHRGHNVINNLKHGRGNDL